MPNVRNIPLEISGTAGRVENGVIQFGLDWPALHIRGDDALSLALSIQEVLKLNPDALTARHLTKVHDMIVRDVVNMPQMILSPESSEPDSTSSV